MFQAAVVWLSCCLVVPRGLAKVYLVETQDSPSPPARAPPPPPSPLRQTHTGPSLAARDYSDADIPAKAKDLDKLIAQLSTVKPFEKKRHPPSESAAKGGAGAAGGGGMGKTSKPDANGKIDGKCPGWIKYECNGKCQGERKLCDGECHPKLPPIYHKCNNECSLIGFPCNGKCARKEDKVCGNRCIPVNDPMQDCNGNCIPSVQQCDGKCTEPMPIKCGNDSCVAQADVNSTYVCDGQCMDIVEPCNGKCHERHPKKCGETMCLTNTNKYYQEVNGNCVPAYVKCGKCKKEFPIECQGKCYYSDGGFQRYDNRVVGCAGKYIQLKKDQCQDVCVDEKTYKADYQDCDGKCIHKHTFCKSKCEKEKICIMYRPEPLPFIDRK